MNPGLFKHRLQFYKPTYRVNSYGAREASYDKAQKRWGRLIESSQTEINESDASTESITLQIRWYSDLDENWRVTFKGETFELKSVVINDYRKYQTITATKINSKL